jgi:hypothetical protein
MPLDNFLQLETPVHYRGTSGDGLKYTCRLSAPYKSPFSNRVVRPYVLTFENRTLTEIELDERAMKRQTISSQASYGVGYAYYPY